MTEEYELSTFDRHSLNYDNVALGRLPTSVTTDPSVRPLRELGYLPSGVMDPHEVPPTLPRAGMLPEDILELMKEKSSSQDSEQLTAKNKEKD